MSGETPEALPRPEMRMSKLFQLFVVAQRRERILDIGLGKLELHSEIANEPQTIESARDPSGFKSWNRSPIGD